MGCWGILLYIGTECIFCWVCGVGLEGEGVEDCIYNKFDKMIDFDLIYYFPIRSVLGIQIDEKYLPVYSCWN